MPGDPATHDSHRIRLTNEQTGKIVEATLWLPKGSDKWSPRGDLDLNLDEEIESGNYTAEMLEEGGTHRFMIERNGNRYALMDLQGSN